MATTLGGQDCGLVWADRAGRTSTRPIAELFLKRPAEVGLAAEPTRASNLAHAGMSFVSCQQGQTSSVEAGLLDMIADTAAPGECTEKRRTRDAENAGQLIDIEIGLVKACIDEGDCR